MLLYARVLDTTSGMVEHTAWVLLHAWGPGHLSGRTRCAPFLLYDNVLICNVTMAM